LILSVIIRGMALVERGLGSFVKAVEVELPQRLLPYKRTTVQQRSREMQRAALGDVRKVTELEYQELIETVRDYREWLKRQGEHKTEEPSHAEVPIDTYFKKDVEGMPKYEIRATLKPWEQSAGRNREPYSKFGFLLEDETVRISFDFNFNDTYDLSVSLASAPVKFEVNQLNRRSMRKPEYELIMGCILQIGEYFGYVTQRS